MRHSTIATSTIWYHHTISSEYLFLFALFRLYLLLLITYQNICIHVAGTSSLRVSINDCWRISFIDQWTIALGNDHPYVSFIPYSSPFYLIKDKDNETKKTMAKRKTMKRQDHLEIIIFLLITLILLCWCYSLPAYQWTIEEWCRSRTRNFRDFQSSMLTIPRSFAQFETELWR